MSISTNLRPMPLPWWFGDTMTLPIDARSVPNFQHNAVPTTTPPSSATTPVAQSTENCQSSGLCAQPNAFESAWAAGISDRANTRYRRVVAEEGALTKHSCFIEPTHVMPRQSAQPLYAGRGSSQNFYANAMASTSTCRPKWSAGTGTTARAGLVSPAQRA